MPDLSKRPGILAEDLDHFLHGRQRMAIQIQIPP